MNLKRTNKFFPGEKNLNSQTTHLKTNVTTAADVFADAKFACRSGLAGRQVTGDEADDVIPPKNPNFFLKQNHVFNLIYYRLKKIKKKKTT